MQIQDIVDHVTALGGVLVQRPQEGDGTPEIAWGDVFFYYAPDGMLPRTQPFATIVTKNYPGDELSHLDRPGAFRVNVAAGSAEFARHADAVLADDVVTAHPVYAGQKWLAVTNPTSATILELLDLAHDLARKRFERHRDLSGQ